MLITLSQQLCRTCPKIIQEVLRHGSTKSNNCILTCRNPRLNHHINQVYDKFKEIPLASKGWHHNKSKGDYFIINPQPNSTYNDRISFTDCGISPELITALNTRGITGLTQFQAKSIPKFQGQNHVMLAAETGCGKTITYLLPIIQSLASNKSTELNMPKALIIIPNRELAYQIGDIADVLAKAVGLNVKILVGGQTKKIMMNPEFSEIDILVATPGALGKLTGVGIYKLNQVLYTVLDEADTIVDDSFIERMNGIIKRVSQSKIILVSATRPKSLPDILQPIEDNLIECISPRLHKPLLNVQQKFLRITRSVRPSQLLQIAKSNKSPMLAFTNRNETCNWLAMFLRENGITCANINGDMNYSIRIDQWNDFVSGKAQILSATDVASRGLDTAQVRHVLNYDFPLYAADYLHRVGRVGRISSGDGCKVTNFISGPREIPLAQQIELAIRTNQPLANVDGNITNIVQKKIMRGMQQNV